MTLVAAIRIEGIPVLLGDMMLTTYASSNPNIPSEYTGYLVSPKSADKLRNEKNRVVHGVQRKAIIVNNNFCVAWTGNRDSAEEVIRQLKDNFSDRMISLEELDVFLKTLINIDTNKSFDLIGWIKDDEFHCFRWDSDIPAGLYEDASHIEGSGHNVLKSVLNRQGHKDQLVGSPSEVVPPKALAIVMKCMALDLFDSVTTMHEFGYFIETIYWDGSIFTYVEEATMSFYLIKKESPSSPAICESEPVLLSYRSFKDYCLIQTIRTDSHRHQISIIREYSKEELSQEMTKPPLLPIASKNMCWYFRVSSFEWSGTNALVYVSPPLFNKNFSMEIDINGVRSRINPRRIYNKARKDFLRLNYQHGFYYTINGWEEAAGRI